MYSGTMKAKIEYTDTNRISLWPPEVASEQKISAEIERTTHSGQSSNTSNKKLEGKTPYDLVVRCDSLRDLNDEGWSVSFNKSHHLWCDDLLFDVHKQSPLTTVAISGVYNSGKTFILNNLASVNLPSNYETHTEGISFKHLHENSSILLMDTAGQNSPIQVADRKSISDKMQSERVLQNALFELATFNICVVQELKWNDQQHFETLYDQILQAKQDPGSPQQFPLIVVHNLMKYGCKDLKKFLFDADDSDDYNIQRLYEQGKFCTNDMSIKSAGQAFSELIDSFIVEDHKKGGWFSNDNLDDLKAKVKQSPKFWFDSKSETSRNQTYHVFLVNNGTTSGNLFNYYVMRQIEDLVTSQTVSTPFIFSLDKVFKILEGEVSRHATFKDEHNKEINPKTIIKTHFNKPISSTLGFAEFNDGKQHKDYRVTLHPDVINKNVEIDLKDPTDLAWSTLYLNSTGWYPKYDVQYSSDGSCCKVFVEIPGDIANKYKYKKKIQDNKLMIKVNRQKESEYDDTVGPDDRYDRHFDELSTTIPIKNGYDEVVDQTRKDGVLIFKIRAEPDEEEFIGD